MLTSFRALEETADLPPLLLPSSSSTIGGSPGPRTPAAGTAADEDDAHLTAVAFSPDARHVATADSRGDLSLWRVGGSGGWTNTAAAAAAAGARGGSGAAAASSPPIRIAFLRAHTGRVVSVSFDGAGRRVITASADGTARLWEVDALLMLPDTGSGQPTGAPSPSPSSSSSPSPSSSSSPAAVRCHTLPGRGLDTVGSKFATPSKRGGPPARWSCRGAVLDDDGTNAFVLENCAAGGGIVSRWRLVADRATASKAKAAGAVSAVRVDGRGVADGASASASASASAGGASGGGGPFWVTSEFGVAAKGVPLLGLTQSASSDRLAITTSGGVVCFDTEHMATLWHARGLGGDLPLTAAAFLEGLSTVVVGGVTGQVALLPAEPRAAGNGLFGAGARVCGRRLLALVLLVLLSAAFAYAWLHLAEAAAKHSAGAAGSVGEL